MQRQSYQRAAENPEAAALFFEHHIPEEKFNLYLSLKPNHSHEFIPDMTIDGKDIHEDYRGFVINKLDSSNPEAAILGKLTGNSQFLGGQGESCAIHGITDPRGGFYVLRDKNTNEMIAQSLAFCSKDGDIVFDSIKSSLHAKEKYQTMIMDFYVTLAHRLTIEASVPMVTVGRDGGIPERLNFFELFPAIEPVNDIGHRGSYTQWILSQPPFPLLQMYASQNPSSIKNTNNTNVTVLNNTQSEEWCDLCVVNDKPWKNKLITFALSDLDMEKRTYYSKEWLILLRLQNLFIKQQTGQMTIQESNKLKQLQDDGDPDASDPDAGTYEGRKAKWQTMMELKQAKYKYINVNLIIDGVTALHAAIVEKDNFQVIKYILENGADVNIQNQDGQTALHMAVANIKSSIVEILIKHGADVNIKNHDGLTVLDCAINRCQLKAQKYLAQGVARTDKQSKNELGINPINQEDLEKFMDTSPKDFLELLVQQGMIYEELLDDGVNPFECHLSLMSIDDVEEIDQNILENAKKNSTLILIKTGDKFIIYGDPKNDGEWQLTEIKTKVLDLNKLPFEKGIIKGDDQLFTPLLIEILKEGHAHPFHLFKEPPKTLDTFVLNATKIDMFLSNKELVDTYLRKLNTLIQNRMNEAGLMTDELQRDHRKVFRKTLEDELEKAGFASGLGKATGRLSYKTFIYAISQGVLLKDPRAGLEHGEYPHVIQWVLICWHQAETNFLNEPVIDFFKKMGMSNHERDDPSKFAKVWNLIVDTISNNYTAPAYLTRVLKETNDPDRQLLKKIITERSLKRQIAYQIALSSGPKLFKTKLNENKLNENKPRTEYDETWKKDDLLLPKPKK